MIHYKNGRICNALTSVWVLRETVFRKAFLVAFPAALLAATVKILDRELPDDNKNFLTGIVVASAYSSFTFLVGLTVVFRTSQSYTRYWDGCEAAYGMMADFFDVASSLVAFCRATPVEKIKEVAEFQHKIIRLFSLLHALILADLESEGAIKGSENAFSFELIDLEGLDSDSLQTIVRCKHKVDLVFQWIQALIVEAMNYEILVLPAPILTRAFQELNAGMLQYHKALKIAECPFPFPYTAVAEMVLVIHWIITPVVVGTWTKHFWSASFFTFVNVFILWSMNGIAAELENPFESDLNDLDMRDLQQNLNARLLMLLDSGTCRTPKLTKAACLNTNLLQVRATRHEGLNSIAKLLANPPKKFSGPYDDFDATINIDNCMSYKSSPFGSSAKQKVGASSLWEDDEAPKVSGMAKRAEKLRSVSFYSGCSSIQSSSICHSDHDDQVSLANEGSTLHSTLQEHAHKECDEASKNPIINRSLRDESSHRGPPSSVASTFV